MPQKQIEKVAVYRQQQPLYASPCILGDPCGICRAHKLNKKLKTPCMMATPAIPAFRVPAKSALTLVKDGLAVFAHEGRSIQLTFSKLAQLRDSSLKIDEQMLIAYAVGKAYARAVVDEGWQGIRVESTDGVTQVSIAHWTPEMMSQSQKRVQSFV